MCMPHHARCVPQANGYLHSMQIGNNWTFKIKACVNHDGTCITKRTHLQHWGCEWYLSSIGIAPTIKRPACLWARHTFKHAFKSSTAPCEQCLQYTTFEIVPTNVRCDLQTTACIGIGIGIDISMHRHRHRHRHQHASASALACIGIGISMHRHVQQHASASASACIGTCIGMHRHRHRHRHTCSRRGIGIGIGISMHRHWHRHRHQHASASASACIGIGISMHRQVLSSEPAQSFWAIRDRLELIKRRFRSNRQINCMYVAPEFAYWTLRPVRTINCPACCEIKG